MTGEQAVVTFRADEAEDRIARFLAHHDGRTAAEDLGTLDGRRRYRVDAAKWTAYTRAVTAR